MIELKAPAKAEADLSAAIEQFGRYKEAAPDLFVSNLALVVSDGLLTRVGSITSDHDRFMPWRPVEGGAPTLEAVIRGLFEAQVLVDYLQTCVVFEEDERGEIRKRLADDVGGGVAYGRQRDINNAVRQVIGGAVDANEMIDLFAVAGLEEARLDILSDEFLSRVAALEQKNLALETLRKLLNDQIHITERTNIVQSRKFREALEVAMLSYTNKATTTAEMITRLIDLARELRDAQRHGEELGLSSEETAFYDALAENGSAREAIKNDILRLMARKLAEMIKEMPRLDWTERESVRAGLRRSVRRLLARYGYPPDLAEDATQLVLRQAELSTARRR